MPSVDAATREAIERAAREEGVDPSFALAVAERESAFNPRARSSKTISGLFQMMGPLRQKYGSGDSDDAYTQAKGWARFIKDAKAETSAKVGRKISDPEAYSSHHFGAGRAGRMMKMDPATPVDQVFTPYEMSINPHFAKAGTVGNLLGSVTSDIDKRQAKFGAPPADFAAFGSPVDDLDIGTAQPKQGVTQTASLDFSPFAAPADDHQPSVQPPTGAPDFSQFGTPA